MKRIGTLCVAILALVLGGGASTRAHAQEITKQHIYSETADPRVDITVAMQQAKREHKRVLLSFGGDWCPDCQMLNVYLHDFTNSKIVDKDYVVVHVWIGHKDKNLDLAQQYGVPIERGVPALAVVDANGKVIYAQAIGEFGDMRHMDTSSVTQFLNHWKA